MRVRVPSQNHYPGCIPVQSMNDPRFGKFLIDTGDQAVGFMRFFAGLGEHARGLGDDQKIRRFGQQAPRLSGVGYAREMPEICVWIHERL